MQWEERRDIGHRGEPRGYLESEGLDSTQASEGQK